MKLKGTTNNCHASTNPLTFSGHHTNTKKKPYKFWKVHAEIRMMTRQRIPAGQRTEHGKHFKLLNDAENHLRLRLGLKCTKQINAASLVGRIIESPLIFP